MDKLNYMKMINELISNNDIPVIVLEDVNKRLSDWFGSGGETTDLYIKQQYDYLKRVVDRNKII